MDTAEKLVLILSDNKESQFIVRIYEYCQKIEYKLRKTHKHFCCKKYWKSINPEEVWTIYRTYCTYEENLRHYKNSFRGEFKKYWEFDCAITMAHDIVHSLDLLREEMSSPQIPWKEKPNNWKKTKRKSQMKEKKYGPQS